MKIFLVILGAFFALVGAGCTVGGVALVVVSGGDGYLQSSTDTVDIRGAALVSGTEDVENESGGDDVPGDVRLRVRAEMKDGSEVFIGVARAADADRYLGGAPLDVVEDYDVSPGRIRTVFIPGTRALDPPADEDFWVESASGPGRRELDWEVDSGEFRFVVTRVEPREGFEVDVSAGVKIPFLRQAAIVLIVSGIVVGGVGVLLIVLGARRTDRSQVGVAPPAGAPPPPTS